MTMSRSHWGRRKPTGRSSSASLSGIPVSTFASSTRSITWPGYCIVNDVSERAYQVERGAQWDKGKGCDTFARLGSDADLLQVARALRTARA